MKWVRNNSLSLVFIVLFFLTLSGQAVTGWKEHNQEMLEDGGQTVSFTGYLTTAHFYEATFENWESEFLQMALFIVLSMCLFQKGSSESKDPNKKEEVDREPDPKKKGAPWPVRKGGWVLTLYKQSLSLAFILLFLISFAGHFKASLRDFNQEQMLKHLPTQTAGQFLSDTKFWFESFQNWQSEFLSVFAIVVFTIFLRQKGSAQSKPVDAPNSETGG